MKYVSSLLIDNGVEQMRKEGKLYAMSLNNRLLLIEDKLKNIAQQLSMNEISFKQLKQLENNE